MTPTLTALYDLFSSILCLCAEGRELMPRRNLLDAIQKEAERGLEMTRDEAMPTCQGKCSTRGDCKGEVRQYRVIGPAGADYGVYWYCDEAVDIDRRNGFAVLEEEESDGR